MSLENAEAGSSVEILDGTNIQIIFWPRSIKLT